jgi:hypothetical protein
MAPEDRVLVRVEIDGCAAADKCVLQMMHPLSTSVKDGCVVDAVWRLTTPGIVPRYARLTKGRDAVRSLLKKYSFLDASGCPYSSAPEEHAISNLEYNARKTGQHVDLAAVRAAVGPPRRRVRWLSADRQKVLAQLPKQKVGQCNFKHKGIAQLSAESGICWYSAMFFSLLHPPEMRTHIQRHVDARAAKCAHCAFLRDRLANVLQSQSVSEDVRRYMYDAIDIGDKPGQSPELDGQNGASMATLLCGALCIPMRIVVAPWMKEADLPLKNARGNLAQLPPPPENGERSILLVRTYRSDWRAPERLRHAGRAYHLVSALVGSEYCGHQVALSRSCESRTWCLSDSDAIRLGILPLCFRVPPGVAWHEAVTRAIPHSNANESSVFCDVSPSQRHPMRLMDDIMRAQGVGDVLAHLDAQSSEFKIVNVEYFYLEDGTESKKR